MDNNKIPTLQVEHLKKYFKTKRGLLHAVDDVSFTINQGETLSLVGESGCGKTTCGRIILDVYRKTEGSILETATRRRQALSSGRMKRMADRFNPVRHPF